MEEQNSTSISRYVLGFLVVGMAWGLTTPFMRKAAITQSPTSRPALQNPNSIWATRKFLEIWYAVVDLVQRPAYAVPLMLNLSGSALFFLIVGQAGEQEIFLSV
jgi:hypothetical protein